MRAGQGSEGLSRLRYWNLGASTLVLKCWLPLRLAFLLSCSNDSLDADGQSPSLYNVQQTSKGLWRLTVGLLSCDLWLG